MKAFPLFCTWYMQETFIHADMFTTDIEKYYGTIIGYSFSFYSIAEVTDGITEKILYR